MTYFNEYWNRYKILPSVSSKKLVNEEDEYLFDIIKNINYFSDIKNFIKIIN